MPKKKRGLYDNINAKRRRIKAGSGEKMRKQGDKGAPTNKDFAKAKLTSKKPKRKRKKYCQWEKEPTVQNVVDHQKRKKLKRKVRKNKWLILA